MTTNDLGRSPSGRAGRATHEAPTGLHHAATIPNARDVPFDFEEMASACRKALEFAFALEPKNKGRNIPWTGPNYDHANHFGPQEALKAGRLRYAEEDQGRDKLDEVIAVILQLGIEQGRRIRRDSTSALLDESYGAIFTIHTGWNRHTSIHTQSGFMANPIDCLTDAIGALEDELERVSRCPRASAIEARRAATEDTGAVHESAVGAAETPNPDQGTSHG